jgi:hypothetical protein
MLKEVFTKGQVTTEKKLAKINKFLPLQKHTQ